MTMTGRDLIIYILQNNLEDVPISFDGGFLNLLSEEEAAAKFGVGKATVRLWFKRGMIKGVKIGEEIYIYPDTKSPVNVYRELVLM